MYLVFSLINESKYIHFRSLKTNILKPLAINFYGVCEWQRGAPENNMGRLTEISPLRIGGPTAAGAVAVVGVYREIGPRGPGVLNSRVQR